VDMKARLQGCVGGSLDDIASLAGLVASRLDLNLS
jgi:hypothetical protein